MTHVLKTWGAIALMSGLRLPWVFPFDPYYSSPEIYMDPRELSLGSNSGQDLGADTVLLGVMPPGQRQVPMLVIRVPTLLAEVTGGLVGAASHMGPFLLGKGVNSALYCKASYNTMQ